MTLEQQIEEAILKAGGDMVSKGLASYIAPSVARIAVDLAREAFLAGEQNIDGCRWDVNEEDPFKQFIQDYE